ncbi:MAG: glycoside hydrolase family 2 protein, partial [Promethearchaeota archaeon]
NYWELINNIVAGYFGRVYINYILLALILVIITALFSLILIIIGIIKVKILHVSILNIVPVSMLIITVILTFVMLKVNSRFNLDYIFFMIGPEKDLFIYVVIALGLFILSLLVLFGGNQLLKMPPQLARKRGYKPALVVVTSTISLIAGSSVFWVMELYFPETSIFWINIIIFFQRFVNWLDFFIILWATGLILMITITVLVGIIKSGRMRKSRKSQDEKCQKWLTAACSCAIMIQGIGIIFTAIKIETSLEPASRGISLFFLIGPGLMTIVALNVSIIIFYGNSSKIKVRQARQILAICLIIIPYWFVFYQPVVVGPPNVDAPFNGHVEELNGIKVPFFNNMVYPSFEMQSNFSRAFIFLNGSWRFQKGSGSDINSLAPRTPEILSKLTRDGQHLSSFDDSSWEIIEIPNSFVKFNDENKYWGTCWFRRTIQIPDSFENKFITLKFLGANYITDVWIDGNYVGYHEGGFTSFAFDVSDLLTPGNHVIAIRIDNPRWGDPDFENRIVPDIADFFNYGGIVRDVYLEAAPAFSIIRADIRQLNYSTIDHCSGNVTFDVDVALHVQKSSLFPSEQQVSNLAISMEMYPLHFQAEEDLRSPETWRFANRSTPVVDGLKQTIDLTNANENGYITTKFRVTAFNIHFWATKSPNLYAIILNLTNGENIDSFCTQTGFRHVNTDGTKLKLNGADLKLAGVSCHEQYPDPVGRSLSHYQLFTDLVLIKNTSSNWWRGQYPFHPQSYIYSDRLGLACWEEAPVFWATETDVIQGVTRGLYRSLWIEIIYRDFNRPSILFWSAGNEPWSYDKFLQYLKDTKQFLEENDPSRIFAFACVSSHDWTRYFRETPLDVVTANTYGGTFDGILGKYYDEISAQLDRFSGNNPGKPIISMEWGMWRYEDDTEQLKCFKEGFQAFIEHDVAGMTWWIAFDYYGPDYYNSMGIYNQERTWHSITFEVMKEAYTNFTRNNL